MHDLTLQEGTGLTIGGVPIVVVTARGKRARLLIATAQGDELDGPLPVEDLATLEAWAKREIQRQDRKGEET